MYCGGLKAGRKQLPPFDRDGDLREGSRQSVLRTFLEVRSRTFCRLSPGLAFLGNMALQHFAKHTCCFLQKGFCLTGRQHLKMLSGVQEFDDKINAARV